MNQRNPVTIVQGGQWGSEAKGAVAANLCISQNVAVTVRTGAINAGHTVVYNGKRYAMQQIPVGWVNPDTQLVIGAGAYIHPETLWREIDMINSAMPHLDVRNRLFIDSRCAIHDMGAEEASKKANRHHKMGATGKGCSEAIVAKIQRRGDDSYKLFYDTDLGRAFRNRNPQVRFVDTVRLLNSAIDFGERVLIEGTQGTLLDLHTGPYPYTTSRMTSAANWIAECGLAPSLNYETVLVCRTYPIRVAGNSGPMPGEIEWTDLARNINTSLVAYGRPPLVADHAITEFLDCMFQAAGEAVRSDRYMVPTAYGKYLTRLSEWPANDRLVYKVAASELHRDALQLLRSESLGELKKLFEMTTVTKKLRRIAKLNVDDLVMAVAINRPSWICMTFMDYEFPELANATVEQITNLVADNDPIIGAVMSYVTDLQAKVDCKIGALQFGPNHENLVGIHHLYRRQSDR